MRSESLEDVNAETPLLLQKSPDAPPALGARKCVLPLLSLLLMKIGGNMTDNLMTSFDVLKRNSSSGGGCSTGSGSEPESDAMATLTVSIAMIVISFILPTLGGLLSDAYLGIFKTLWLCVVMELTCTIFLTVLDSINVIRLLPPSLLSKASPFREYMGFSDTMLLHTTMLLVRCSFSRLLLINLYFITRGLGETLANLPGVLRYLTGGSHAYTGVIINSFSLVCMLTLSRNSAANQALQTPDFRPPGRRFLKRFYKIAAGCIPFFAAVKLSEYAVYWRQLRYFANATTGVAGVASSYTGLVAFQAAAIPVCTIISIAAYTGSVPRWFTMRARIRIGLSLMAIIKVPLLVISLAVPSTGMSAISAWTIFIALAICDGMAHSLATCAWHELMVCLAQRDCKATFIGVFYTVWGFANLLKNMVVLIIVNGFATDSASALLFLAISLLCLMVASIVYWEKVSWPLVSGPLAEAENEL